MKKLLFIASFLVLALGLQAQIAEAWITMPDSLCPYLTQQQRYYMLQNANAGKQDTLQNVLGGKTIVNSVNLSTNLLDLQITENLNWKLSVVRTPSEVLNAGNDSKGKKASKNSQPVTINAKCVCLEATICAPICSTVKYYYDFAWNLLYTQHLPFVIEQTEEEKEPIF